jgi:hypothetical protein
MKRFTDTAKWQDPWFRRLSGGAKMLWYYLTEHADPAGVTEIDMDLISEDCKMPITEKHMAELGDRVQLFGNKALIPKFITFQYSTLSESCPPHKRIFEAIAKHGLIECEDGAYRHPDAETSSTPERKPSPPAKKAATPKRKAKPESREEFDAYFQELKLTPRDAEYAWAKWEGSGWLNGGKPIKDWRNTVRSWQAAQYWPSQKSPMPNEPDWPNGIASRPAWLPENWLEIAVRLIGPSAADFKSHTQVPTEYRHAFEMACRGQLDLEDLNAA